MESHRTYTKLREVIHPTVRQRPVSIWLPLLSRWIPVIFETFFLRSIGQHKNVRTLYRNGTPLQFHLFNKRHGCPDVCLHTRTPHTLVQEVFSFLEWIKTTEGRLGSSDDWDSILIKRERKSSSNRWLGCTDTNDSAHKLEQWRQNSKFNMYAPIQSLRALSALRVQNSATIVAAWQPLAKVNLERTLLLLASGEVILENGGSFGQRHHVDWCHAVPCWKTSLLEATGEFREYVFEKSLIIDYPGFWDRLATHQLSQQPCLICKPVSLTRFLSYPYTTSTGTNFFICFCSIGKCLYR